ncbi:MAG: four-helix bundle copper-binding protein [Methanobacteriota archaeon]
MVMSTAKGMHEHAKVIRECEDVCRETLTYCFGKGGRHVEPDHLQRMIDCIEMCGTTADFAWRGSPPMRELMRLCAEVCDACEKSCKEFSGDKMMQDCAEACRDCADQCRNA